ncbi:MAG: deoxycytidylate deaminase [Acidobacteriaceae bacterium]
MIKPNEKWDHRFLELARHVAGWSKDPNTKVGAVIVAPDRRVVSMGFNGLPRSIEDTALRLGTRELKLQMTLHAEHNAILFAREPLHNCTLYTWPFMTCSNCAAMVIQSSIARHVAPYVAVSKWGDSFKLALEMFHEANVDVRLIP